VRLREKIILKRLLLRRDVKPPGQCTITVGSVSKKRGSGKGRNWSEKRLASQGTLVEIKTGTGKRQRKRKASMMDSGGRGAGSARTVGSCHESRWRVAIWLNQVIGEGRTMVEVGADDASKNNRYWAAEKASKTSDRRWGVGPGHY